MELVYSQRYKNPALLFHDFYTCNRYLLIFIGFVGVNMKKKSFPLENYFMYLSDHLLDDAEELLTGGHLILREKSKDNLWVFEAEEDRSVEIEILLKRKTVANKKKAIK